MLYDLCRPVAKVKRPDCSNHTVLNDPTFMSIFTNIKTVYFPASPLVANSPHQ